ncbi:MAG: Wzz/FepE/Etk N-terminal domain-containing protein [Candidatus Aminicenantales bacterium]
MDLDRIDLMEYINIAWKHRWQIIIPTIILAVLAGSASFLLPKIWEVDAILIPSKFLTQNQVGEFKQVLVAEPKQIAGQIMEGSYNALIAAQLNIPDRDFPKIKAENLRETNLVRISVREKDPRKGKQILEALFGHLKSEFDKKIDVEMSNIHNQIDQQKNKILELKLDIESKKIDKEKTKKDIEADKNKIVIREQRISDVIEEMKSVKNRVAEIEDLQRKMLSEKKEGAETLGLLLYSNEVQQNLQYRNTLEDKVSAERVSIEDLAYEIQSREQQLHQIDNEISRIEITLNDEQNNIKLLEDKKNRIDYSLLVKEPTSSLGPVSRKKKQIVLIVGFLGFCLSLGIVLFRENLRKQKTKDRQAA